MAENSKIEWTDNTWNPWQGCKKVSAGCQFCYMYRDKKRYGQEPSKVVRSKDATFNKPLKWNEPARVFTCSWSDFFILQAKEWVSDAWDIIRRTPHLTYLILTKRPENIATMLPADWGDGYANVWLGVSVENESYLHRVNALASVPAALRFVSYEPALSFVDWEFHMAKGWIDWLISGGESGSGRLAKLEWFENARDQCAEYGIPYFHKQHGGMYKIDGSWGGNKIDGKVYHQFPAYGNNGTVATRQDEFVQQELFTENN